MNSHLRGTPAVEQVAAHDRIRLVKITPANLRNNHVYITGHHDFFPKDCFGPAKRSSIGSHPIKIALAGLGEEIVTDIGTDQKSGKPRSMFRDRSGFGKFFRHHDVKAGDELTLERLGDRSYRLSVAKGSGIHHRPRAAEFFAGIGLVRLALERQGWDVVYANDYDPDKAEMYRHNWPENDHLVVEDIFKLDPKTIPSCDLFTASFPCNDLSIAGKWEGLSGKESSAFWGLIKILKQLKSKRPSLILLENVVGFLMSHGGKDLRDALLALNGLGYSTDAVILNATHWVPQSRQRLFIIGRAKSSGKRHSFTMASDARPPSLMRFIAANQDLDWDLRELPHLPAAQSTLAQIVEPLADDDPQWWSEKRVAYFMEQLSDRHLAQAREMIACKRTSFATAFRRVRNGRSMAELRTDGIAGCLRTPRGGSARQILFKAGRGMRQVRLLTARECARLQGVPETYSINVPLNQALFGFGDAVCVPVVEWITANCLKA